MLKKLNSIITLSALLLMLSQFVSAQTYRIAVKPSGQSLWGYCDLNEEMVINPKYKKAFGFSEDGFAVVLDPSIGKYVFIDKDGTTLKTEESNFKLKSIVGFRIQGYSDGLVAVRVGKPWGFFGIDGKYVFQPRYHNVMSFNEGYASAKIGTQFYLLNTEGNELKLSPDIIDVKSHSDGLFPFRSRNKLWGFINTQGEIVIPAKYLAVGYFVNGLAWAKATDNMIGFINNKDEVVIDFQFRMAKNMDPVSGMAKVAKGEIQGYVNRSGEFKVFAESDICQRFENGYTIGRKSGLFGFLNTEGEWIVEPQFIKARPFKNGYAAVKTSNELWGMIDEQGNWLIEPKYVDLWDVEIIK